ncbi:MAG TPA: GNAT family N-acetyltransferase [Nitrococcus sp.]|nr:GNAT family N-acetyltransferase [Nitrococcus sp.]
MVPPNQTDPSGIDSAQRLREFATALLAANRIAHHRQVLILTGGRDWCRRQAEILLEQPLLAAVVLLSDRPLAGIVPVAAAQVRQVLGGEIDALVVDAWAGFDPNAFGAAIGAVQGGGLALLLAPPLADWPDYADPATDRIAAYPHTHRQITGRYLQRLVRIIRASADILLLESGKPLPSIAPPAAPRHALPTSRHDGPRTLDQQRAVTAIEHCARGHRHRPVVLTSDRGRGKSAALGIAAARLLSAGLAQIIVTAPSLAAATAVFAHARRLLPGAQAANGQLSIDGGVLEFMAPDALLRSAQSADLLLVDEAAALPTPILSALLRRYARIVFASTVHGYEGTGRGFALRFRQVLERYARDWREHWLEAPIRWAPGDPAERFTFQALLLNALPAPQATLTAATAGGCRAQALDRNALAGDERTLNELFGLLVLAHYRTSPADLRHLLDAPDLSVWALRYRGHIAAAALLIDEGGFVPELAQAIWLGIRRPRGHLVAQSLATHAGLAQAPMLNGRRVLRIAVHPACQGRGLGTRLLRSILGAARSGGIDYLAAAFGATAELIRFWARSDMRIVRLGSHRSASSGDYSAIVLRPLSPAGRQLAQAARERFADRFPHLLNDPLRELDPELALLLLQQLATAGAPAPTTEDWDDLLAFGFGQRSYADASVALRRLARYALTDRQLVPALSRSQQVVLLARMLQQRDWSEIAGWLHICGRQPVVEVLRAAARHLALTSTEPRVRRCARELLRRP